MFLAFQRLRLLVVVIIIFLARSLLRFGKRYYELKI